MTLLHYFFWFDLFLEARAEILEKKSLVFWKIWRHQKDILQLTDLYNVEETQIVVLFVLSLKIWKNTLKSRILYSKISACPIAGRNSNFESCSELLYNLLGWAWLLSLCLKLTPQPTLEKVIYLQEVNSTSHVFLKSQNSSHILPNN